MNKKRIVYLSGHIKELEYRRIAKEKYSENFIFLDPVNFDIEEQVRSMNIDQASEAIVKVDKGMILKSDILIAFINKPTFGTIMEVIFAYENNIPVYVINENGQFMHDYWLYYHATELFNSIDSCFEYLISNGI